MHILPIYKLATRPKEFEINKRAKKSRNAKRFLKKIKAKVKWAPRPTPKPHNVLIVGTM